MTHRHAILLLAFVLGGCPTSRDLDLGDDGPVCEEGSDECAAACTAPRTVGQFELCVDTTDASYTVTARYLGQGQLALEASEITLNGKPFDATEKFDKDTKTFTIHATGVEPSKYSFLFRLKTDAGDDLRPLFVPMWIGSGTRYADFTWHDSTMYQIVTDRFLDGDASNNLDNSTGDLARVTDTRSQWQGGDFAGITKKIRDGYFDDMGVNTLWISSPIINSHNSQPAVALDDTRRFASYHSYHPIATGYTHLDHLGYATPIEPAFGTAAQLHELVDEAHARVRKFAEAWPDRAIVQRTVAQLPWRSNLTLLDKLNDPPTRLWYARKALELGMGKDMLVIQIENRLHERQGKAINNFPTALPPTDSDMTAQIFKDPYIFDFLGTADPRREAELEQKLIDHIQQFLLELGQGFAFVGRQVHLEIGDSDFYLDLLFYHLRLRCYVVIELKAGKFEPGHISQLNMYLNVVDDLLRHPDDKPSIGLLLVKDKDRTVVEYSLAGYTKPIGVAQWERQMTQSLPDDLKPSLPSIEEIEAELEGADDE